MYHNTSHLTKSYNFVSITIRMVRVQYTVRSQYSKIPLKRPWQQDYSPPLQNLHQFRCKFPNLHQRTARDSPIFIPMVSRRSSSKHAVRGVLGREEETHCVQNLTEVLAVHHGRNAERNGNTSSEL